MKNINILNLFIATIVFLAGCNPLKKMVELSKQQQINVNPNPIMMKGGNVVFDVETTLPKGCYLKEQVILLILNMTERMLDQ